LPIRRTLSEVRALALVMMVGCGRYGLDPLPDAHLGPSDSALPACAIDGTACDDRNICTTSSSCAGGACVGAGDTHCTVARSMDQFSETQGDHGWYYGFWDITDDTDGVYAPSEFIPGANFSGLWRPTTWQPDPDPDFTWAYLAAWGGHPGSFPLVRASVRRWVSSVEGDAIVRISHAKADTAGGDGTRAMLVVDGVLVLSRDVAFDDGTGFVEDVPVALQVGSTVDLLLHCIGEDSVDTTTQGMDILSL
jgi:hypothetical protein